MGVALLKFSQGASIGGDGRAFIATISATTVTIENSDNTDVGSYKVELLYAPPDSTTYVITPGVTTPIVLASGNGTPNGTLDVSEAAIYGCYRLRLTVWTGANQTGDSDVDIRNVGVPTPNKFIILPPYQKFPDPLPLPGSGDPAAKPDEMNFEDQGFGWSGPEYDGVGFPFRLVNEALKLIDDAGTSSLPTPTNDGQFLWYDAVAGDWVNTDENMSSFIGGVPVYQTDITQVVMRGAPKTAHSGNPTQEGFWVLGTYGPTSPLGFMPIQTPHITPAGPEGAIMFIRNTGIPEVVWNSGAGTPSVGDVLYWSGSGGIWTHVSLSATIDARIIGGGGVLVANAHSGTVANYPTLAARVLVSDGATPGGLWVNDISAYIAAGSLDVDRLAPGTNGQFLSVVGGVATWVASPGGVGVGDTGSVYVTDETDTAEWSPGGSNSYFVTTSGSTPAWLSGSGDGVATWDDNGFPSAWDPTADSVFGWDDNGDRFNFTASEGTVFRWSEASGMGWGKDVDGLTKVTFDELYVNTAVTGSQTRDVNPDNGQKQTLAISGNSNTINFVDPNPAQPCNIMLLLNVSGPITSLNFTANGGSNTVYGASGVINVGDTGLTVLGVFFDGTDFHVVSSPLQASAAAATIVS